MARRTSRSTPSRAPSSKPEEAARPAPEAEERPAGESTAGNEAKAAPQSAPEEPAAPETSEPAKASEDGFAAPGPEPGESAIPGEVPARRVVPDRLGWFTGAIAGAVVALVILAAVALVPPLRDFFAARLAPAEGAAEAPASAKALDALAARVKALEGADVGAMAQRLDAIERRVGEIDARAGAVAGLAAKVDALAGLGARVARLEATVADLGKQTAAGRAPDPEVAALKTELASLKARLDAAESRARALAARVDELEPARAERGALHAAFAVTALIGALRDGASFKPFVAPAGPALAAAGEIGKRARERLAGLDGFAESGVPDLPALAREFEPLRRALMAPPAAAPAKADAKQAAPARPGLWARIRARIAKLVTVSRIGESTGRSGGGPAVATLLDEARHDLAVGNVRAMIAALDRIPPPKPRSPAATALDGFAGAARARIRADELIADLRAVLGEVAAASAPAASGAR